ncbi:uncharacterized protein LOC106166025 isoform X2 [Lingula anatina]|uniref:Uncharacterized protein LOC106166025 isoform X1 n=1 Tax=Lingula anatina TaxID=7574 RepID=A0A1S3INU6_LINAN|nr:uncharacterized protein LOC106166025 isoform X1 [Lingula anatina]XP_013399877.1 uncharacterized protein LOC106166025 isoform X2 [Lingula anatina]|eukprot:XP_013399876.1 uncharacterized protein LOC106166025 isoform X1 [Lingula anatina]
MRISAQVIRSRAKGAPQTLQYLDLSNLELVAIEKIDHCAKLHTLILQGNNIDTVSNLSNCQQLWKLDLSNNQIRNLEGLDRFIALGTVVLTNNNLTWAELGKLQHIHIIDLSLQGNPQLEKDPYYRIHVIDCLPNVWMLDGRIITSAERLQVQHFFQDSALTDHPVRHKLGSRQFVPSSHKKIQINGIYGEKTVELFRRFPVDGAINVDTDKKRLKYIAYNLQEDMILESRCCGKKYKILNYDQNFLEELLEERAKDRERGNMFLLLLVATLEFAMPTQLIKETLDVAKLSEIGKIKSLDLFLLPREVRCSVVSLLLSAVKVDKDEKEAAFPQWQCKDGGLYDRLYLCLYYTVSELARLGRSRGSSSASAAKSSDMYKDYRCLLASEVVQLLCIVPAFFDFLDKDVGVMNLVATATGDYHICDKVTDLAESVRQRGGNLKAIYEHAADFVLNAVQENTLNLANKGFRKKKVDHVLTSKPAYPKRPQSSPLVASEYHMRGRSTPMRQYRIQSSKPARQTEKKPKLGERILLGPQNVARVMSIPQTDIALVQMDVVAGPHWKESEKTPADMVTFTRDTMVATGAMVSGRTDAESHFSYIDMTQLIWDDGGRFWRPRGTVGDRITIQSIRDRNLEATHPNTPRRSGSPVSPPTSPSPMRVTSARSRSTSEPQEVLVQNLKSSPTANRPMSAVLREKYNLKLEIDEHTIKNSRLLSGKTKSGKSRESLFEDPSADSSLLFDQVRDAMDNVAKTVHLTAYQTLSKGPDFSGQGSISSRSNSSTMTDNKIVQQISQVNIGPDDSHDGIGNHGDVTGDGRGVTDGAEFQDARNVKVVTAVSTADDDNSSISAVHAANTEDGGSDGGSGGGSSPRQPAPQDNEKPKVLPPPISIPSIPIARKESVTSVGAGSEVAEPSASAVSLEREMVPQAVYKVSTPESFAKPTPRGKQGTPSRQSAAVGRRPFSAVDAYKFIVAHPINDEFNTNYQNLRTEAWKRSTGANTPKNLSRPSTPRRPSSPPPQRPTSPSASKDDKRPLNVQRGNSWLAGGKDLYWEDYMNKPNTIHVPGWKEELLNKRPHSAAATRAFRRAKPPSILTPSSMLFDRVNSRTPRRTIPDFQASRGWTTTYGSSGGAREVDHARLCSTCLDKHLPSCPSKSSYERQVQFLSSKNGEHIPRHQESQKDADDMEVDIRIPSSLLEFAPS